MLCYGRTKKNTPVVRGAVLIFVPFICTEEVVLILPVCRQWLIYILCLGVCLFAPSSSALQDFKRIGVGDGLPNATIYSVTQDSHGYIWLTSTNSGLLRFDGYKFAEFQVLTPDEKRQLGSQDVGYLLIDRDKNMWAGTWGYGLSRIDAKTGALSRYVVDNSNPEGLASLQIQTLLQTKDGSIWIGSTGGLNRIQPDGTMQRIGAAGQLRRLISPRVWSLAETADGTLWVGTSQGLHRYTEQDGLSPAILPYPQGSGRDNEIRALFSNDDKVWIGTRQGLFRLQPNDMQLAKVPFFAEGRAPIINAITADQQGMLLLGTYNGLFRVHPDRFEYLRFRKQASLLPTVNVRSLFLDRSGVLWLGSRESGLFYARHSKSAFTSLSDVMPAHVATDLAFGVTSVFAKDDELWLGSAEHLYQINKKTESVRRFDTGGRVNAIKQDSQGVLYAASDVGLFRFDPVKAALEPVTEPFLLAKGLSANIRDLTIEANGNFWVGLWGDGVLAWNPKQHKVQQYLNAEIKSKVGDAVQSMLVSANEIWVGSRYSGVFRIDRPTGKVTNVNEAAGLLLPSNDVQCIERGPANTILICTATGLVVYDPQKQSQQLLDSNSGLPSDNIFGAYTDQQQNIWLLSSKGLSMKQSDGSRLITFTEQDGLAATELVFKSFFDDGIGSFYIGTINGLSMVEPALIWKNDAEPPLAISRVLINNRPLELMPHRAVWPDLTLTPSDTSIEFEFSSLDFHDVMRNQFMYRLKGFDSDWIMQPGKRGAYYSNLPAGTYQLEVRGSNNHGLFNTLPLTLTIKVLPHWWQYRLVQILGIVLILLIILGVHLYRMRHFRQINRLLQNSVQERAKAQLILETKVTERTRALEESSITLSLRTKQLEKSLNEVAKANLELTRLDKLKDEFISTVSHELRTPLTSIRGAVGLIAQHVVEPGSASYDLLINTAVSNCERLSQLINDLLDVQKFEAGKFVIHRRPLDLVQLCTQAVQGMESYAVRYQVSLSFDAQEHEIWVEGDALRLRQVIDNLLSNAIKFSWKDGIVSLKLSVESEHVLLEVVDQGEGIPLQFQSRIFEKFSQADASDSRAKEGTGLGLTICRKIIESHDGTIGFVSTEGVGTTFWVRLIHAKSTKVVTDLS